ncbi:UDP-glucuronosyltransferase 2B31-like [Ylistrum balloti]|uniref:UDP-glucuronosyltransferase 2B31-like n=1 Tax=Ylistrum balloti TaxID=509963 RepID=UPI00290587B7|nr:UDP-glucuronosyltransferase 2B31-like [Ylistrum balloti]
MLLQIVVAYALFANHVLADRSENILVLALPTFSHTRNLMDVVGHVTQTYGYSATVVTSTTIASSLKLQSNSAIHIIISSALDKADVKDAETRLAKEICHLKGAGKKPSLSEKWDVVKTCDNFHNDTLLLTLLKRKQFRLAIIDNVPLAECFSSFAYKLSLPYIFFGVLYDPVRMRVPFSPASTPFYFRYALSDRMSFFERMHNVLTSVVMELAPSYLVSLTNVAKYTPNKSPVTSTQLMSNASFHLVETDFLLDYPKPSLPHVAFVGGISTTPPNTLTDMFQTFIDSSQYGAVVVSFGSGLNGFPEERIGIFVQAFKQRLDLNFIVKHGSSGYVEDNIMFSPWIPQNDLLGHPKTVAFMTHCGNNGQFEALYHGVPMIGFPLFSDQYYNCERMRQKGYGVVLDFCSCSIDDIKNALTNVTSQHIYINNIKNASQIFHSRTESPLQRASYWIDHIIRYGNKFIHSYSADMPWYQYYLLDILMVVAIFVFLAGYIVTVIFNKWLCLLYHMNNNGISSKTKSN